MNFDIEIPTEKEKKKKKQKNRLLILLSVFFLILTIILIIIYIISLNKSATPTTVPEPTVIEKEKKEIQIIQEDSNERPIAIMIDNNIGDIKHAGLQNSYINYEIIVEGGITRIMALYKDAEVGIIGPVRSARHYFLDYALEHDAIFAHFGWSPKAESDIAELNVKNINGMTDTKPFARDTQLPSPHNVFTSTTKIRDYLDSKSYIKTSEQWKLLNYSAEEIEFNKSSDGETTKPNLSAANKISIVYSNSQNRGYTYDTVNKYYLRSQNGKAHLDRKTEAQLHFKNIIIMKVENKTIDEEGRQDLTTIGTGTGYFITNGYALPINWSKTSRTSKTKYTFEDGTDIILNDGNTFIQIVPLTSNITIE